MFQKGSNQNDFVFKKMTSIDDVKFNRCIHLIMHTLFLRVVL